VPTPAVQEGSRGGGRSQRSNKTAAINAGLFLLVPLVADGVLSSREVRNSMSGSSGSVNEIFVSVWSF
jgi:hypothetical protein